MLKITYEFLIELVASKWALYGYPIAATILHFGISSYRILSTFNQK